MEFSIARECSLRAQNTTQPTALSMVFHRGDDGAGLPMPPDALMVLKKFHGEAGGVSSWLFPAATPDRPRQQIGAQPADLPASGPGLRPHRQAEAASEG
jgi:hypothetical protein